VPVLKKTVALIGLAVLMSFLTADPTHSKIEVKYDEFDETTTYMSTFESIGPWRLIRFNVFLDNDDALAGFSIELYKLEREWHFFSNEDMRIKIDKEIIAIPVLKTDSEYISHNALMTYAAYLPGKNAVDRIVDGEEITMRVYMSNRPDITWDVPERVLAEWKELLYKADVYDNGKSSDQFCFIGTTSAGR